MVQNSIRTVFVELWANHQTNHVVSCLAPVLDKVFADRAAGMFLIPVTVLAVLAASLAPVLRGNEESGLEKAPKDFSIFRAESEMTNGRGAMVGLVALLIAEKFTGGAALF